MSFGNDDNPQFVFDEENPITTEKKIIAVVTMIISVIGGAMAIILSSSILGIFFSYFIPIAASLELKLDPLVS